VTSESPGATYGAVFGYVAPGHPVPCARLGQSGQALGPTLNSGQSAVYK